MEYRPFGPIRRWRAWVCLIVRVQVRARGFARGSSGPPPRAIQHRGTRELQLNRGVNPPALHCKGGGLAPSSIAIAAWTVEQLPLLLLQLQSFPKPP